MTSLKFAWLVALFIFHLPCPTSADSGESLRPSSSRIVASLLAVKAYEFGMNNSSAPSSSQVKAARRYFSHGHFRSQLELDLAELKAELVATKEAQNFTKKATEYGLPSYENLLFRDNYILSYDNRLKQPSWSLEYLTNDTVSDREHSRFRYHCFRPDQSLHEYFRTDNEDYKGYSRGHYSPVCDNKARQKFFRQCYLLSNMAPQVPTLNHATYTWSRLERYIYFVSRRSTKTFIITGTLFLPDNELLFAQHRYMPETTRYRVVGSKRVAVPSHFYKVVLAKTQDKRFTLEAFLMPNSMAVSRTDGIDRFRIDVDKELPQIEMLTGLRFFEILNRFRVEKPKKLQYDFAEKVTMRYFGTKPNRRNEYRSQ